VTRALRIIPFVVLLVAACSGGEAATSGDNSAGSTPLARTTSDGVCHLTDDTVAPAGSSAPSTDGCNTCTCEAAGWSCTELACR
jgi:hypothetical protein